MRLPRVLLGRADPRDEELRAVVAAGMSRKELSQNKLAKKIGMEQGTLSRHLKYPREMRIGELRDISDALGIPVEDLMRGFKKEGKK